MALTPLLIDIGQLPNDGTGDPLRVAFDKINNNSTRLSELSPTGNDGEIPFKDGNVFSGSANLSYDVDNNIINVGGNIVPITTGTVSIGTASNRISNIFLVGTGLTLGNIKISETNNVVSFVQGSTPTDLIAGNISMSGVSANSVTIASLSTTSGFTITTTTNEQNQIIFEDSFTKFTSGTFEVASRQPGTQNSQYGKIRFQSHNDNAAVSYTISDTTFNGAEPALTHYSVDRGYGNIRVSLSPFVNDTLNHTVTYTINR